jgi:hypothetical protein
MTKSRDARRFEQIMKRLNSERRDQVCSYLLTDDPNFQAHQAAMKEERFRGKSDSDLLSYAGLRAEYLDEIRRRLSWSRTGAMALIDASVLLQKSSAEGDQMGRLPKSAGGIRPASKVFCDPYDRSGRPTAKRPLTPTWLTQPNGS